MPAEVNVHDRVELPDPPAIVVGVRVHALLSDPSVTSPVNPFRGDTVIVDVPADPTTTETVKGAAVMEKSAATVMVNVTVVEWDREPLVPVTVTVTVLGAPKTQPRMDVPEPPVTVAGVSPQARLSEVRATSLVNPFKGAMVMVEVPEPVPPGLRNTVTAVGLAETVKSGNPVIV